jgi:hypothetical protein
MTERVMNSEQGKKSYDVFFSSRGRRFYFRIPNHGVQLSADSIAWSFEGRR